MICECCENAPATVLTDEDELLCGFCADDRVECINQRSRELEYDPLV